MRQRCLANAFRNEGFSATVSDRALIMRLPIAKSSDQEGTSPQRIQKGNGFSSAPTTAMMLCVGQMLNLGEITERCRVQLQR
jgi:hypothetical protein